MPAVTRICAWKYKDCVSVAQRRDMLDRLMKVYTELRDLINYGPNGGKDVSGLGQTHGYDIAYIVEYKSKETTAEFNASPVHLEYAAILTPLLDGMFVYDFVKDEY
ncbi:hypothetical protein PENSPDRAFT_758280 [Peniophora sp. CONT]|nr:hypothetical protein PENSPDRAFT_758280 [Peniophora sp. CONT]